MLVGMSKLQPITCAPDCDWWQYDDRCMDELSREGSEDGDDY
jgi:hypothetical protein